MKKFGYAIGYVTGTLLTVGLYALAFFGIYSDISSGQLPIAPLAFLFSFAAWRRVTAIESQVNSIATLGMIIRSKQVKESELDKLMGHVQKFGGPN